MLKKIALVIVAVLAGILLFATTKPATFRVERSATIKAPADTLFALIEDFHRWPAWSPWEKLDPNMQRTFGGADHVVVATYDWSGNSKVGRGGMKILEANAPSMVKIQLDFLEPFASHNQATFTLTPAGDATTVQWVMEGPNNFMSKVMSVFVSMDAMIGKDFEAGLANLKAATEH